MAVERSALRAGLELAACTIGIYIGFIGSGILHEKLFKDIHYQESLSGADVDPTTFLVYCQCDFNMLVGLLWVAFLNPPANTAPWYDHLSIGASYLFGMVYSNTALSYVTYPVQIIVKSCKLVPVMLMRVVINGARYSTREYFNVALMVIGIVLFQFYRQVDVSSEDGGMRSGLVGVCLLLLAMVFEGYTGPKQERMVAVHKPPIAMMMFMMNYMAVFILTVQLKVAGTFNATIDQMIKLFTTSPDVALTLSAALLLSAVGQICILITVYRFDSLTMVTITTTRKLFTFLASVLWFGHAMNTMQWGGVSLIFIGLGLNILDKYRVKQQQTVASKNHPHAE